MSHFLNKDLPCDLLTNKSWKIFERFKIRDDFLRGDPKIWKDLEEYKEAKQIISSLKIIKTVYFTSKYIIKYQ